MKTKRLLKLAIASVAGLGGVVGATVVAVSCGPSVSYFLGTYAYDYSKASAGAVSKTDKNLVIWLSYKKNQEQQTDLVTPAIEKILKDGGYSVSYVDDSSVNYANASVTLANKFQARDYATLPDIIINYPDIQAILERYDLAQDYDELDPSAKLSSLITSAWQFDVNSVFTNKPGAYAMPFLKSTDLLAFDVPAFAMLLNDIALQRGPWETLQVRQGSPQQRIIYMILAPQSVSDFNVRNVYSPNQSTTYKWSEIAAAWKSKTAAGGIWEGDFGELKKHFKLKTESKSLLLGLDWTQDFFGAYDGIRSFSEKVTGAYEFLDASTAITAVDSVSNTIYSYQYDLAGHDQNGFFIRPDNSLDQPRMIFDFDTKTPQGASLVSAVDYVSSLINMKALGVKLGEQDWASSKFSNHSLFFASISSNAVQWSAPVPTVKNRHQPTLGDVYFDLQPSKAGSGEQKRSIINQGPSLMVTRVHGQEGAKIADLFKQALASGLFSAKYNHTTGKDEGILGTLGYIYADTKTYEASNPYISALKSKVSSTAGWPDYVAKYLLTDYLSKAEIEHWDTFNNPAAANTSLVRKWFNEKYSAYVSAGSAPQGAAAVAEIVNYIVPDARLYKI